MRSTADISEARCGAPAVVFAPEVFLAQMSPKRDARSTGGGAAACGGDSAAVLGGADALQC